MAAFITPFTLFLVASICVAILAAALPFAIWYYFRAKELAPKLAKKALLEADIEKLTAQYDKLREDIVRAEQLIKAGEDAKKWLEDNQKLIDDLKVQVVRMNEEYEKSKSHLDDYKQKIADKQTELAELNTKIQDVDKLIQQKYDLTQEVGRLTTDIRNLQTEKNSLEQLLSKMRAEHDKLKKENDELQKEIALNRALKEKNEQLSQENAKFSLELDNLRKQAEEAKISIARSEAIKTNEANMWKDLERPVAQIDGDSQNKEAITNEEKALWLFKQALDDSGYAFNERTIKAFHTGLLCGGVSPLVVLSGISGTGKSLLPELYAKAFGMNFLPVAVQPRWDGPQDVFGFYNHMEGRFKATELSRLIWQFDRFNNPQARNKYQDWKKFPMSLVLLDEMNLARVEYYFSELLSKLEIRNRVTDPDDAEKRFASEVELEYGASSVTNANNAISMARRLYVGNNILFVGTMNEDESTQTLSSKVIDRSNVLRFGTPESLKQQPDEKKFQDFCQNFVSYQTWTSWARPYGEQLPNIDKHIETLKELLKSVEHGFGHRTERAIKQYVEFYPGNKQDALADQIEMKILPKLNGVEADLIRDKLHGPMLDVLKAIHDTDVTEALNQTLQSEGTFFNWKGVRR